MSDQNSTTPDSGEAVPGFLPPATPDQPAPPGPPAYTPPPTTPYSPPAASGGYAPPPTPGAYEPPTGGYSQPPGASYPPPAGSYPEPPTPGAYEPPTGGYSQPPGASYPPPAGSYPEPPGPGAYPPAYGQGYQDPNAFNPGYQGGVLQPVGGAPLAEWPKRALGGLIDYVAAGVAISIVGSVLSNISSGLGGTVNFVLSIGWMLYLGYLSGTTGITPGRALTKTKLIGEATGAPVGVSNGIVRQLAHIIDTIICYIGWLFPLWDAKKQTIADKIMKTVVIDNSADPNAGTIKWS
ncbi:MAG: RDD family protein [Propionibacteriaceae bacterium]|nr:RDD family protein [Propionibacteriaceae bacterium]